MIEPMSKIFILLHNNEKKKSISKLQNLGLLHLELKENIVADKYRILTKKKALYESILQKIIKLHRSISKSSWFQDKNYLQSIGYYLLDKELSKENSIFFPEEIKTFHQKMLHIEEKFIKLEKKYQAYDDLKKSLEILKPWGSIDWDKIISLENYNIKLEFYVSSPKTFQSNPYPNENLFIVKQTKNLIYIVRILYDNPNPTNLIFERVELPKLSIQEITQDIEFLEDSIRRDEAFFSQFYYEMDKIIFEINNLESLIEFEKGKQSLVSHPSGMLFGIEGYFPTQKESLVSEYLNQENISYIITKPKKDENIPIQLKNNFFTKSFEPITKIFSLPNYSELDPTPFFAPFFTIFFGLCLGDIGYGLLLLVVSFISYPFIRKKFSVIANLLVYLSLSAILSGILLNSFFGESFFKTNENNFAILDSNQDLTLLASYTIEGKTVYPSLPLSLFLGYIQLSLGIFLQSINRYLLKGFIYTLQPISMLLMLWGATIQAFYVNFLGLGFNENLVIGILPIGRWITSIPIFFGELFVWIGLAGFFIFSRPSTPFPVRILPSLWDFYQMIIGFTGDILSYIRLFALGLASGLLGNAFNQVAFMFIPEDTGFSLLYIFTGFILIIGHSLNFALSVLGSFVHPLRLTFVEFYKNLSFTGGGREFKAFGKIKNNI